MTIGKTSTKANSRQKGIPARLSRPTTGFQSHALGLEANAWTVNKRGDMEWLAAHALDYLTTDYPEVAMDVYGK